MLDYLAQVGLGKDKDLPFFPSERFFQCKQGRAFPRQVRSFGRKFKEIDFLGSSRFNQS